MNGPTARRGRGRLARSVLALGLAAAFLCAAGGCRIFCPFPTPSLRSDRGTITLGFPLCRRLVVREQSHRRDSLGHLVVYVRFENTSRFEYLARVRVKFMDADGMLERGAYETDLQRFRPGETALEWTSSAADAAGYHVEVMSGKLLQW